MSKFPTSVALVYGKGIEELLPGYPAREDSPLLESDFKYVCYYIALSSRKLGPTFNHLIEIGKP